MTWRTPPVKQSLLILAPNTIHSIYMAVRDLVKPI